MKNKLKRFVSSLKNEGALKTARKIFFKIGRRLSKSLNNSYTEWLKKYDKEKIDCSNLEHLPLISILMPTYNTKPEWLEEAIESVKAQSYTNWELCIVDDASTNHLTIETLKRVAKTSEKIKIKFRESNGHIAKSSNDALEMASGEWIALLDHDDVLHKDALAWVALAINRDKDIELIYTDEDKLDAKGNRINPFFKPDWSPHLALSQAYLGHLVCIKKSLIDAIGGFDTTLNGAQDYDLWLRASLKAKKIFHIPKILYHWRIHKNSTSSCSDSKPYANSAGEKAVNAYLKLKYPEYDDIYAKSGRHTFTYQICFGLKNNPLISIIIPTKDKADLLEQCIESIRNKSTWQNFEIIIMDNNSCEKETFEYFDRITSKDKRIKVLNEPIPFNWSKLNNIGAKHAEGDTYIFLNNDTIVISCDWMERMAGFAALPDVGVVGALLLFEDGTIQHSGVVVGMNGWADHIYKGVEYTHYAPNFISPVITRNTLAVTGACMAITRERFDSLGGFDEEFTICGSDVEIGIRAHKKGYYNVMCAEAMLYHLESKTRTSFIPKKDFIESNLKYAPYRTELVDPYFNVNLSLFDTTPIYKL